MSVYAKGRRSVAISDRSGFRVPYRNLRTEWNGSRVASDEYEPKHPQLTPPRNITDATALYKPRPNNDKEVGEGFVVISDANNFTATSINSLSMNPSILGSNFTTPKMTGSVGTVTITT